MSFLTNSSPYGMQKQFMMSPGSQPSESRSPFWSALFGKPERNYQQTNLGAPQMQSFQNLLGASQGKGAGGAFGESADYYRDLLSDDSQTAEAMSAPELRRFRQQIIPELAEQFSGYGGIGSSGFRNAATSAGVDLAERLGSIRASLRQQGAEGLRGIGQSSLGNFYENIHRPETFGLIGEGFRGAGEGLGKAAGTYLSRKFG